MCACVYTTATTAVLTLATVWVQVTDEEGRRRFHGAFTGGYSAGYFNSVGSKEGWQPKTFASSRQSRETIQQRAEDFMDEEDDPLLGKRLATTEQYDVLQLGATRVRAVEDKPRNAFEAHMLKLNPASRQPSQASVYPAMDFLDDLVLPVNDSIGAKLLNQMGWKEGHGIGPRIRKRKFEDAKRTDATPTHRKDTKQGDDEAEEEDVVYIPPRNTVDVSAFPKPKMDKYGAGFDPYVNAPEFSRYKQQQASAQQQKLQKRQIVTFSDAMKATAGSYETTTGFGLSALEENDDLDVYGSTSMAEFDTAIGPAITNGNDEVKRIDSEARESLRKRLPTFCTDGRPALPGFELAYVKEKPPKAVMLRLRVPSDFKPYHRFTENEAAHERSATALYQNHNFSTGKHGQGSLMTATQRAVLLGESGESEKPARPVTESNGSVFEMLGAGQKAKLFAAVAQSKWKRESEDVAPTPKAREPLVKGAAGDHFRANISASIAKRFVSASAPSQNDEQQTADAVEGANNTAKQSYRTESSWIPNSLLCKRFHVKCLVGASSGALDASKDEKRDLFDKELVPHLVEFAAGRHFNQGHPSAERTGSSGNPPVSTTRATQPHAARQAEDDEELPPLPIVEKPAMSLLKSIFEPSDESECEEDDDEATSDDDDDAAEKPLPRTQSSSVARDRNSVTRAVAGLTESDTTQVSPKDDTKRNDLFETSRVRDRAAGLRSDGNTSSSSDSEGGATLKEKQTKKKLKQLQHYHSDDASDSETDYDRKKTNKKSRKSSSKKHKSKHKKRSSRDAGDDDSDKKDKKKRKKDSKKASSSRRHSSSSRKRSRSRSRDRSESRSKHRRH